MKMYLVSGDTSRSNGNNIEAICFDKKLTEKKNRNASQKKEMIQSTASRP